eukprot:5562251-Pleurochrysis_carterae.AAC.1
MAGPACTGASDFFHPPTIHIADFFSLAGCRVVMRGVGRRGAPARRSCTGVASGPPHPTGSGTLSERVPAPLCSGE